MSDIQLNSRFYHIAEDAEGQGYIRRREPLRVPNSNVVKGAEQFQLRPDIMQWTQTSWVGGEGQIKWDKDDPSRSYLIVNTDPFSSPGNLILGPLMERGEYSAADLIEQLTLVRAKGYVYGVRIAGVGNTEVYRWNPSTETFDAKYTDAGSSGTTAAGVAGDGGFIYFINLTAGLDEVWKFDGTTWTLLNNQASGPGDNTNLIAMGNYLYVFEPGQGKVYEISKTTVNTATAETAIYEFDSVGDDDIENSGLGHMIAADNRLYVMQQDQGACVIHEIVPTTAAAEGYGYELSRLSGVTGRGLQWMAGFVVLQAKSEGRFGKRYELFYLQPDAALGTFGEIRSHLDDAILKYMFSPGTADLRYLSFLGPSVEHASNGPVLFLLDTVTGGFAQIADGGQACTPQGMVVGIDGSWLIPTVSSDYTFYTQPDKYGASGYAISPYYDFDLADEKVLREISITCEPLPANTTVVVSYDLGDGTFTTAGTYTTDDGEGTTYTVSTDSATKTFRHMRVKLTLTTTTNTVTPTVRSVEVRASVVKYINTWEMLFDLSDDDPNTGAGGRDSIDALLALAENTVYPLKDFYNSHHSGDFTEYDVEIDSIAISLSQPGEGMAQVVLREV